MSTTTAHLGIKKPDPDDFFTIKDLNSMADKIDTAFATLSRNLKEMSSDAIKTAVETAFKEVG